MFEAKLQSTGEEVCYTRRRGRNSVRGENELKQEFTVIRTSKSGP